MCKLGHWPQTVANGGWAEGFAQVLLCLDYAYMHICLCIYNHCWLICIVDNANTNSTTQVSGEEWWRKWDNEVNLTQTRYTDTDNFYLLHDHFQMEKIAKTIHLRLPTCSHQMYLKSEARRHHSRPPQPSGKHQGWWCQKYLLAAHYNKIIVRADILVASVSVDSQTTNLLAKQSAGVYSMPTWLKYWC